MLRRDEGPGGFFRPPAPVVEFVMRRTLRGERPIIILAQETREIGNVHVQEVAGNAGPGTGAAGPRAADPDRREALHQWASAQGTLSAGPRDRDVRPRLLLGRRAQVLGAGRRGLCDR